MNLKTTISKSGLIIKTLDILLFPISLTAIIWLRLAKFYGLPRLKVTSILLRKLGLMPLVNHYYEPFYFFDAYNAYPRELPGIDFNEKMQLELLREFSFAEELESILHEEGDDSDEFYYINKSYSYGDADMYYSMIRHYKPSKIVEIGSGFSTKVALKAIAGNLKEKKITKLTCIEPYEYRQIEKLDVELIKSRVEEVSIDLFRELKRDDILFIDSSHVIKPEGDVLFEYLRILPSLNSGVLIHIHDIFTPYHYPRNWIQKDFRLWNEQYLLEALLTTSDEFEVILASQYLKNKHQRELFDTFPVLSDKDNPNSMWIRKIK